MKAPRTCPKSSLSIDVGASAGPSTGTKGCSLHGPILWIVRATRSFPVPVSPEISTGDLVAAASRIKLKTYSIWGDHPTRVSMEKSTPVEEAVNSSVDLFDKFGIEARI